jgi:hypothetical protein
MRIGMGHESADAAQFQQRVVTPAKGLQLLGHKVYRSGFTFHGEVITLAKIPDEEVWRRLQPWIDDPSIDPPQIPAVRPPPDVMTLRLFDQADPQSTLEAREHGQLVFFDLDDDVWHFPDWSGVKKWLRRSGEWVYPNEKRSTDKPRTIDLDCLETNYRVANGVLCSTSRVAEAVTEAVPEARTFITRNGIDAALYYYPRKLVEHAKVRVAWMGSTTEHNAAGFLDVIGELAAILEEYDCEFWHLGAEPANPDAKPLSAWLPKGWKIPVRQVPWAPIKMLPWLLSEVDVGVIARRPHIFHEAQSNVTGLAYAAAGMPFVASRSAEYERLEKSGAGKCYDHPKIGPALVPILESRALRDDMRRCGRDVAVIEYSPAETAKQWQAAFEAARDG